MRSFPAFLAAGAVAAAVAALAVFAYGGAGIARAAGNTATTTVIISVCGDGNPNEYGKVCDNGTNTGQYATSTAGRQCMPGCQAWGPYCGDGILQTQYGEQCDDGPLNGTPGDGCSATCQIVSLAPLPGPGPAPAPSGYSPGSPAPLNPTTVVVEGKAYPGASVNILDNGATLGVVQADSGANFYFSTTNVSPGVATFGIWAQDSTGMKSIALTTTFTITANAATTISGELVPPTITVDKRQVSKGGTVTVSGQSVPNATIEVHVHSGGNIVETTSTNGQGVWSLPVDTSALQNDAYHTVDADFVTTENGAVVQSIVSQLVPFYVGSGKAGKTITGDLNGDGKVNLADFSILLYYWGANYPPAEFDGGSTVDLGDLSIMLYNWTG